MKNIIDLIKSYIPFNEEEAADQISMLRMLSLYDDILLRSNLTVHMTASGWVVNPERNKVLMAYHNLYNSWAWLGGHADGNPDLLEVALKEVREESSIKDVKPVSTDPFSIEILTVNGHIKKGTYVPSHLHLNVTFLLEADDSQFITHKPDENSAVAWFTLDEALEKSTEPWIRDHIYKKLNDKLKG